MRRQYSDKDMVELIVNRVINRVAEDLTRYGNMSSIIPVIELYREQIDNFPSHIQLENVESDLLRAMIVFSHASLEEAIRQIARLKLIEASPEIVKKIPLKGTKKDSKYTLDKLLSFRGQLVDDVLQDSIDYYLDRFSIRTFYDIENMIDWLKIDRAVIKPYSKTLNIFIKRRHKIVHESDRDNDGEFREIDSLFVFQTLMKIAEFTLDLSFHSFPKSIKQTLIENGKYQKTKETIQLMSAKIQNLFN